MTEAEANALIEVATPRIVAHVMRLLEIQIRDFAFQVPSSVPADAALLALADDIRDNLFLIQSGGETTLQ